MKNIIAIVAGEPFSINSEIIGKSWKKIKKGFKKKIFVIGNYSLIKNQLQKLHIDIPLKKINSINFNQNFKSLKILDVSKNSKYVVNCLSKAHDLSIKKKIKGFINCSVDKKVFKSNFGVTEFLEKKNKKTGSLVMMIYNKRMSVVPITTHISIKNVASKINKNIIIKKIKIINDFYIKFFKKKPIIAVLGLNPHNDELRSNSEEKRFIIPAIKKLKIKKYKVIGPLSADTVFLNKKKYNFDVVVGMYHDQVLSPFKALYGFDAINITLGLEYLRISPDHGTATDIFGKNKASPVSLLKAIDFIFKNK